MLHTNFQGNWPSGSGEKDLLKFWGFVSMTAIVVMWPWPFDYHYFFLSHTFSFSLVVLKKMVSRFSSRFFNSNDLGQGHLMSLTSSIHKRWTWLYFHTLEYKSNRKMENFSFSYSNAKGTKIDLAVKWVKVNPGSWYIQTMQYYRP